MKRAVDHQLRHLIQHHLEVIRRNPVALEIRRGIQKVDRVRHIALDRKLNRVHFVAQRLIDALRILHDALRHRR